MELNKYYMVKPVESGHPKEDRKLVFHTNYHLMLKGEHSTILSTFIKLPFVIKTFVCLFMSGCFT